MKKTIVLLFAIISFPSFIFAQKQYTSKKSEFGISMELNNSYSNLEVGDLSAVGLSSEVVDIESKHALGFALGVMYRYRLNSFLLVRTQGVIAFTQNRLLYKTDNNTDFLRKKESVNLEFPLHFVLEKETEKIGFSTFLGGRYSHDIANEATSSIGNFKNEDVLLDIGIGMAFKFEKFKVKPELIYSKGLINQVDKEFASPLESMFNERFSLRFSFYN